MGLSNDCLLFVVGKAGFCQRLGDGRAVIGEGAWDVNPAARNSTRDVVVEVSATEGLIACTSARIEQTKILLIQMAEMHPATRLFEGEWGWA